MNTMNGISRRRCGRMFFSKTMNEKGGCMDGGGIIELKSVGGYFRPSDLATSTDGTFNEDDIFYLSDIDNYEWWFGLSKEDRAEIEKHFDVEKHLMNEFDTKDLEAYHKEMAETENNLLKPLIFEI